MLRSEAGTSEERTTKPFIRLGALALVLFFAGSSHGACGSTTDETSGSSRDASTRYEELTGSDVDPDELELPSFAAQ